MSLPYRDDVARKMQARKEKEFSFLSFVQEMIPHLTITEMRKEGQQAREKADQ